ncbi:MAG TPA: NAD-dependent epimerase/dehydratase family protein [Pirellulales bacterium]|jgi:dihydroflavonol-4-reductase|nr:NAD-dependent epimerase/dehydratase family protein [Pirellulales bacterium]
MLTLVTGGTGLVGNNVVRALLERGQQVRVLTRATSDPRPLKGLDVEQVAGDVREADAVLRACQGVDRIVHAAAMVHIGWGNRELHQSVNVEGTRHVVAGALASGAQLIHVSTVDTLGLGTRQQAADEDTPPDPRIMVPYITTKRAAERLVLDAVADRSLNAVIVNPAYMLGPWDWKPSSGRMLLHLARGRVKLAPRGGNDFCDVRDVAGGILAAAERGQPGRRFILGGEPLSYLQAWRLFAQVIGVSGPICRAGPMMVWVAGKSGDVWRRFTGHEPDINSASTGMSAEFHHYSYARAVAELGYAPRSAREAATGAWRWFQQHGYCARKPAVQAAPSVILP